MAKKTLPEIPGLFDDLPEDTPKEQIAKITLKGWRDHLSNFSALERKIEGLLDDAVKQTLAKGRKLTPDDIGRVFQRHPEMRRDLEKAMQTLNKRLTATIEEGSKEAWLRANATGNEVALALAANNAQLAALLASGQDKPQNDRALRAFMKRKEAGMNLSDRVWKTTMGMKLDMERAIDVALAEGMSADRLSLKIRKLLREPNRLYRRVRDKDGNLRLSQAAQKYHPGTGVYRSSYKNAMRVARTEVNMAYQASDNERWTNSWWIRGIRVSLSNNHTTTNSKGEKEPLIDICDELRGDYPPDFKFIGWHPQCRCFATAITVDYDEIRDYYRRKRAGEDMSNYKPKGLITDVPMRFKNWMERNADRLAGAAERGTTPYFIKENPKYTDPGWKPAAPPKPTIQQRMDERHAKRTPADIEKIQKAWNERKARIEAERLKAEQQTKPTEAIEYRKPKVKASKLVQDYINASDPYDSKFEPVHKAIEHWREGMEVDPLLLQLIENSKYEGEIFRAMTMTDAEFKKFRMDMVNNSKDVTKTLNRDAEVISWSKDRETIMNYYGRSGSKTQRILIRTKQTAVRGYDNDRCVLWDNLDKEIMLTANTRFKYISSRKRTDANGEYTEFLVEPIRETRKVKVKEAPKPPHHEDYKPQAEGMIMVSPLHNKSELKENLKLAETLSRAIGSKVYLLPEINPEKKGAAALRKEYLPAETKKGKNPDFMGGGKLWDGKTASFKNTPNERAKVKATIENHIKKAKQQADNFIIEIPEWINQKWVDEAVTNYLKFSSIDRTIIIRRPDGTFKTYKK